MPDDPMRITLEELTAAFHRAYSSHGPIPSIYQTFQTAIPEELQPMPTTPNAGAAPLTMSEFLGLRVVTTANALPNGAQVQDNLSGTTVIYVNPRTPTHVWQASARQQYARRLQRAARISIKRQCRLCGKAYPRARVETPEDHYCSDRCRAQAADLIDCPLCSGTGNGRSEGDRCGECYGSSYAPCEGCAEDHARTSLAFTSPASGRVYHVCPACVADEREAGAVPAPKGA